MNKRFIVLVDMTEHSGRLLQFAYKLAVHTGASFVVAHQSDAMIPAISDSDIIEDARIKHTKERFRQLSEFTYTTLGTTSGIKFHITRKNIEIWLLKLKKSKYIDIIFVGMKSKSLLERIFMRSTTLKLVNEINKIIVALPESATQYSFKSLHIAVKEKYPINISALQCIVEISEETIDNVHFFSMLPPGNPTEKTNSYLQALGNGLYVNTTINYDIYHTESPFEEIKTYMQKNKGILVLQKGGRELTDMFRKYFVNDLVNYANIPLIILP